MDGFFPEGSFFAAVAFTSPERRGNPTGVVFAHPEWSERTCQRIAAELGFPDTAFLTPRPDGWAVRFFSPAVPLSLCVQALIACGAVLARRGGGVRLFTDAGEVEVRVEPGRVWAVFPKDRVREVGAGAAGQAAASGAHHTSGGSSTARSRPEGRSYLSMSVDSDDAEHVRIIDSGRVRRFEELADRAALEAVSLPPPEVMEICRRTGLQGLCFWTRLDAHAIALRVFTPSLDGGEDASTGGAVLGLSALLGAGEWRVEQGSGPFHRTGALWLRAGEALEVGGAVKVIASGMLAEL